MVIWLKKYIRKLLKEWPGFSRPFIVKCKERNDFKKELSIKKETDWKIWKFLRFFILKGMRKLVQERI